MCTVPQLTDLDLTGIDTVAIDLETHDPNLKTLGSGAIINVGKVVGIAVAFKDKKLYYPIGHVGARPPYTAKKVWKNLNEKVFQNKDIRKVFHNAMYDVCWIRSSYWAHGHRDQ